MKKIRKVLLTVSIALALLIAPLFLLWGVAMIPVIPYLGDYFAYKKEALETPDAVLHQAICGDLTLEVHHRDSARAPRLRGVGAGIDLPQIDDVYTFRALRNGEPVLTLENGGEWNMTFIANSLSGPQAARKVFLVDEAKFQDLSAGQVSQDTSIVAISVAAGIPEDDVEEIARCYARDAERLNEAWHQTIAAFVITQGNARERTEFSCADGRTVAVASGHIRVEGDAGGLVGTIDANGSFVPFTGELLAGKYNPIPLNERNLTTWGQCKASDGTTLSEFVQDYGPEIVNLAD